jgi:hypothetical protein
MLHIFHLQNDRSITLVKCQGQRKNQLVSQIISISLLLIGISLQSCSFTSKAFLGQVQTSNTYPTKVKLKTLVYIPQDLENRNITFSPNSTTCSAWSGEVNVGQGYRTTVVSALSSALQQVDVVNTIPNLETAKNQGYDVVVSVKLSNESASHQTQIKQGFWSTTALHNAQFQISFGLTFNDRDGKILFTYTANGSGFGNLEGDCDRMANVVSTSIETALKQVADNISQSTYGNADLRDYSKLSK